MNWQHLIYFTKVAQCEHLSRAAEELYISSSALSRAIISLEKELGVELFDRDGRNIKLNRYGRVFFDYAMQAVQKIDEGTSLIHSLTNEYTGTVIVSSIFSVGASFIPRIVADFHRTYPDICLELTQKTTTHILQDTKNSINDIGFCGEFDSDEHPDIIKEYLYDEDIKLIVPKTHRFANKQEVTFADIRDEIFIGYNNNTGMVNTIYEATTRKGDPKFRFKTAFRSNEDGNVVGLVREGLGIAFIVDVHSLKTDDVAVLTVKDLLFQRSIYMIHKKGYLSPAANAFRKYVIKAID